MRGDTAVARTSSTARDTAGPPRIAVLPFEDIARDTGDAFFAEGMHEEVLNQLSKVSGLEVLSRTTMMQVAETELTAAEIGRELDASAILEGTVRRAGDRLRITAQLIDARRDAHLWSNTYDRALSVEEIFDIQADVAQQITGALETELTQAERGRIESAPTSDLAAYNAFLGGRTHWSRYWTTGNPPHVDQSVEHLRNAVDRDSTFAEAQAWLALAYGARSLVSNRPRWLDSASVRVDIAESLDPGSGQVQMARGAIYLWQDSLEAAQSRLHRAVELQPSSNYVLVTLAGSYRIRERWVEHVRSAHEAVRLDPRASVPVGQMGWALHHVGLLEAARAWHRRRTMVVDEAGVGSLARFSDVLLDQGDLGRARAISDSVLTHHPDHHGALALAGKVALYAGDAERAKTYLERVPQARRKAFPEDSPTRPDTITLTVPEHIHLGLAQMRLGERERGRELLRIAADSLQTWLERSEAYRTQRQARLAGVLSALGQDQRALRTLQQAAEGGLPRLEWIRTHPLLDGLRSEPRFASILSQIEANQEKVQGEVRQLGIALYPPGAEPDTASREAEIDG